MNRCIIVIKKCLKVIKRCLNVIKRCLIVIKRCLIVIKRCLNVIKRCLNVIKRCLIVIKRCLNVIKMCLIVIKRGGWRRIPFRESPLLRTQARATPSCNKSWDISILSGGEEEEERLSSYHPLLISLPYGSQSGLWLYFLNLNLNKTLNFKQDLLNPLTKLCKQEHKDFWNHQYHISQLSWILRQPNQ